MMAKAKNKNPSKSTFFEKRKNELYFTNSVVLKIEKGATKNESKNGYDIQKIHITQL